MEPTEFKARLWMWGPFILAGLLFAITVFFVVSLLNKPTSSDSGDGKEDASGQSILAPASSVDSLRRSYLAANGGEALLAGLRSTRTRGILETPAERIPFLSVKRRPGQSLLRLKFPDYEQSFVIDGDVVWVQFTGGQRDSVVRLLEGDDANRIRRLGTFFDPVMELFLLNEGRINEIERGDFQDETAIVVEFEREDPNIRSKAYIDPDNLHLISRVDTLSDGNERRFFYSDYREVDGVLMPFDVESYSNETFENRVIVEKSEHNIGIYSDYFGFPEDAEVLE
ncbi:MAG: hypothetical protein GVY36_13490 [Verrucomicrobia bacterium]|jgi:hypothetical protein|nr:hypothetical protein [Verrucomicrobiota bacterium]